MVFAPTWETTLHARRRTNASLERSPPKAETLRRRAPDRCQLRFAPQAIGPASLLTADGGRFSPRYPPFSRSGFDRQLRCLAEIGRSRKPWQGPNSSLRTVQSLEFSAVPQKGGDYAAPPSLVLSRMVRSAFGVLDSASVIADHTELPFWGKTASGKGKDSTEHFVLSYSIGKR